MRTPDLSRYTRFPRVASVTETATGLEAGLGVERLRVDVVRPDIIRVAISRGGSFDDRPSHAVVVDPFGQEPEFTFEQDTSTVTLSTEAVVVTVTLEPFAIDVHRADGSPVIESAPDGPDGTGTYATLNDAFVVRRRYGPADAIFGLGEKTGSHNRRGRDFTLWNTDILHPDATAPFTQGLDPTDPRSDPTSTEFDPYYMSIPFFHHQSAATGEIAGSFVDNVHRAQYRFSDPTEYSFHFDGGHYVEYVFAGPDMSDVIEGYTWLTGRPVLPPMWALGYHQCRWHTYTQDAVEGLAARHRSDDIPCDSIWLDIEHMDGYRVFTWDRELFPDPDAMIEKLADDGFKVVTIVDPGVKHDPGWSVFDEAADQRLLCETEGGDIYIGQVWPGRTAFPDFVTEETRAWWGRLNAQQIASGVAGIWNDMNEPATGAISPYRMRFERGRWSHERYHNQYALLMAMGTVEGLLEAQPDMRTFVLTRAGSAGIQRYSASWTGDNMARWDHLWLSIPMVMGLGVSGQPFAGADIGGFRGSPPAELFLRWMQCAALTPFFRNHAELGNPDRYAWAWGPQIEGLVRDAVELRYRLLPYLYTTFVEATESGRPVQRPLVLEHQYDPVTRDLDDEYLLGHALLVAPVTEAGTTSRQVYLPEGDWYDWHTGDLHEGGRFVRADTPMDRVPLYARGGAVIPMWSEAPPSTDGYRPDTIELHLFVPRRDATTESLLDEDDGVTFARRNGAHLRTRFAVVRDGTRVRVEASTAGDGYPEFARTEFRLVVHGAAPETVDVDGRAVGQEGGSFRIPNQGEPFVVDLEV